MTHKKKTVKTLLMQKDGVEQILTMTLRIGLDYTKKKVNEKSVNVFMLTVRDWLLAPIGTEVYPFTEEYASELIEEKWQELGL